MRVAALLRGINIGSSKRVSMPELAGSSSHSATATSRRTSRAATSCSRPRRRPQPRARTRAGDRQGTGLDVPVLVRTGRELAKVVAANPYAVDDPTRVVVAFLGKAVKPAQLGLGDLDGYAPDELTQVGKELFVSVPNGQGRSKLMEALTKKRLPTVVTVRNWRTVAASPSSPRKKRAATRATCVLVARPPSAGSACPLARFE